MTTTPADCLRCGNGPLRPATRHDMEGIEHVSRGLCRPCWRTPQRGTYPPLGNAGGYRAASGRRALDVLEDAEHLLARAAATRVGFTPDTRRVIAARLGMTQNAFDKAIYRARDQRDAAASCRVDTPCAIATPATPPPVTTARPRPRRRAHRATREGVIRTWPTVVINMTPACQRQPTKAKTS